MAFRFEKTSKDNNSEVSTPWDSLSQLSIKAKTPQQEARKSTGVNSYNSLKERAKLLETHSGPQQTSKESLKQQHEQKLRGLWQAYQEAPVGSIRRVENYRAYVIEKQKYNEAYIEDPEQRHIPAPRIDENLDHNEIKSSKNTENGTNTESAPPLDTLSNTPLSPMEEAEAIIKEHNEAVYRSYERASKISEKMNNVYSNSGIAETNINAYNRLKQYQELEKRNLQANAERLKNEKAAQQENKSTQTASNTAPRLQHPSSSIRAPELPKIPQESNQESSKPKQEQPTNPSAQNNETQTNQKSGDQLVQNNPFGKAYVPELGIYVPEGAQRLMTEEYINDIKSMKGWPKSSTSKPKKSFLKRLFGRK